MIGSKRRKAVADRIVPETTYTIADALSILKEVKSKNFDESVDVAIRLGISGEKSDQNVRGAVTLPNSLGKQVIVAVFADGDLADLANKAGAEFVGLDELAEKFQKNEINVDVVIPMMMTGWEKTPPQYYFFFFFFLILFFLVFFIPLE